MRCLAIDLGQHDVLENAAVRQQVEGLKHEADALAAQARALLVVELGGVDAVDEVLAVRRPIEASDDVEKRRLAGARGPGDGQPVAAVEP